MRRILVVYGTTEGHTRKIADFIAGRLRQGGHEVSVFDSASPEAAQVQPMYDGAIVGGSLHQGKHQSALEYFIRNNKDWLVGIPTAFFSVSLAMASDMDDERKEAQQLARQFVDDTGLNAGMVRCFAGALLYTKYDYFKRFIMRRIAGKHGEDVDTSQDYEYTDWDDVTGFVDEYLAAAGLVQEQKST